MTVVAAEPTEQPRTGPALDGHAWGYALGLVPASLAYLGVIPVLGLAAGDGTRSGLALVLLGVLRLMNIGQVPLLVGLHLAVFQFLRTRGQRVPPPLAAVLRRPPARTALYGLTVVQLLVTGVQLVGQSWWAIAPAVVMLGLAGWLTVGAASPGR